MSFKNKTRLESDKLERMLFGAVEGWPHEDVDIVVRYSRGADFSGVCYYDRGRIHVNLGRHNRYPYQVQTVIARPQSNSRYWWRELYSVEVADAYQLALFVFLHEFYHWLVKKARRNVRQKEARCDRFAARALVDVYAAIVRDSNGHCVPRSAWDFQDLDGFVAAALRPRRRRGRPRKVARAARSGPEPTSTVPPGQQLLLFEC